LLEIGGRTVLRLAPGEFRREFECELRRTFREICLQTYRQAGAAALLRVGLGELIDLARTALRARLGGQAPMFLRHPEHRPERRTVTLMRTLSSDVRLGVRSLLAARSHTAIAVLTLAVGLGATTAAFSVLDSMIFRPLPFADAERMVEIWNKRTSSGVMYPRFERALFLEWRRQTDLFDRVEGYEIESAIWRSPRGSEMVPAAFVTPGIFALLGVPPIDGRYFGEGDGRDGSDRLVVIGEGFWREQLGARSGVVASTLSLNGATHTIVGVMPAHFGFPTSRIDAWLPLDMEQPPAHRMQGRLSLGTFARVAPGLSPEAVTAVVESRAPSVIEAAVGPEDGLTAAIHDPNDFIDRHVRQSLIVLAGAVGFLLLIVCANVANLSLSRALARARDCAVRASLGASRGDLIRETLVENALVGAAGVALGLGAAVLTVKAATASLPAAMFLTSLNEVDLDLRALAFTALVGLMTVLLFGLPPALIASRPAVADVLRRESRSSTGSRGSRRLRSALVVAEVTVSIVLLVGAALMARSFLKLQAVDRGFDSSELAALRVGLPAAGYADPRARDRFSDELVATLERTPGIRAATVGSVPPDSNMISFGTLEFEHAPDVKAEEIIVPVYQVWPDYFETTGIRLADGRAFTDDEPRESAVVSQSFADKFWPGRSAVGGRFRFTGASTWRTVVGVAGEVRQLDMDDSTGSFEFYYPLRVPPSAPPAAASTPTEAIVSYRTFVIRAADPATILASVRQAVTSVDDTVVIWDAGTVEDNFIDAVARPRVVLFLLSVLAGLGLLLAAGGLYGVLSHLVGQRVKEIGIRLALGASPRAIFRLVLHSGLRLTAVGLAVGLVLALFLVRIMRTMLYEVEPTDPLSVIVVMAILAGAALFASWRPARRAMRVDPVALLRQDC
jgi:predicted permease